MCVATCVSSTVHFASWTELFATFCAIQDREWCCEEGISWTDLIPDWQEQKAKTAQISQDPGAAEGVGSF